MFTSVATRATFRAAAGRDGRFRIDLPPNRYTVDAGPHDWCFGADVTVVAERSVRVMVYCPVV